MLGAPSWQVKPPPGTQLIPGHPLNRGLELRWLLNDGANRIRDISPRQNDGTLTNTPTWRLGPRGKTLRTSSGSSQYVIGSKGIGVSGATLGDFAMGGWFFIDTIASGAQRAFATGQSTMPVFWFSTVFTHSMAVVHGGTVDWDIPTALTSSTWTHLIVSRIGTAWSFYKNGVLSATTTASATFTCETNAPIVGGNVGGTFVEYTTGNFDDVFFYTRALTPREAWSIYSKPYSNLAFPSIRRRFATVTVGASCALTGTIASGATEADIVAGGETIILTLTNDTWVASGATFNAIRQDIIDGIDSAQSEANGWDAVVKAGLAVTDVARTSDTVVTITLPAFATYNVTATETITATVPGSALTGATPIVAAPTFTVAAAGGFFSRYYYDQISGGMAA